MELAEGLASRRSVRRFLSEPLPRGLLEELLAAATMAPNAHNAQPWRFVVVERERGALVAALSRRLRSDLRRQGVPAGEAVERAAERAGRFLDMPALVLACLDLRRVPEGPRPAAERLLAVQSVAAAVQNLLLAAHGRGLGGCWYCAPAFCPGEVRRALRLPDGVVPQALVALGRPAEAPAPPPRRPLAEVVVWR